MKLLLPLALLVPLAAWAAQPPARPPAAPPVPEKEVADEPQPLPEYPKADPASKLTPLNPDKTLVLEVLPGDKGRRVGFAAEVCLTKGSLEFFLCRQGTKEHEAVVRVNLDIKLIHAALEAAGAKPGRPVQFVNPKTEEPEFKPAAGAPVKVLVHYKKDGRLHTHPAQEWVWNAEKKKPLEFGWVFAGSMLLKNLDDPTVPPYYAANSGDVIGVSNSPYCLLDLAAEVSRDDASLSYEVRTARVPPLASKVWVILEPEKEKK